MGTLFSCTVSWIQTVTQRFQVWMNSVQLLTKMKALILIKNVAPSELKMTPNETDRDENIRQEMSISCV